MKLFSTFRRILNEVAARDEVVRAIQNRQVVIIYYDGDEPGGKGYRTIEPVCLGELQKKNGTTITLLRAWDIEGSSHTATTGEQPLPGWRLFNLNKISSWKVTGENFDQPRSNYNFNGDKSLSRVIINAKF
jgi:predicted DNA-binding transcriptional regulator YafY